MCSERLPLIAFRRSEMACRAARLCGSVGTGQGGGTVWMEGARSTSTHIYEDVAFRHCQGWRRTAKHTLGQTTCSPDYGGSCRRNSDAGKHAPQPARRASPAGVQPRAPGLNRRAPDRYPWRQTVGPALWGDRARVHVGGGRKGLSEREHGGADGPRWFTPAARTAQRGMCLSIPKHSQSKSYYCKQHTAR